VAASNLHQLPAGLPVPVDDGATAHLPGAAVPAIVLPATSGQGVALDAWASAPGVLFFYPRTGEVGRSPGPEWDAVPGARGCTPQSCAFRDLHGEFRARGVRIAAVSTQDTDYQREFVVRNHIPFEILSDARLALTRALALPTFEFPVTGGGPTTLIKRMAWYVEGGRIAKVWYPVFPPDKNAETVLAWLDASRAR
jgi:peroxiredoxin